MALSIGPSLVGSLAMPYVTKKMLNMKNKWGRMEASLIWGTSSSVSELEAGARLVFEQRVGHRLNDRLPTPGAVVKGFLQGILADT